MCNPNVTHLRYIVKYQQRLSRAPPTLFDMPTVSLGQLIALLVLIVALVFWIAGRAVSADEVYGFVCALALARLIP